MPSQHIEIPLNGPTYSARGRGANIQDCINWYPEQDPSAKTQLVLYPTPGSRFITAVGETATTPIRGLTTDPFEANERMWAVHGTNLVTITPQGPDSSIGYVVATYWDFNYTEADALQGVDEEEVSVSTIGAMSGFPTDSSVMMAINQDFVFVLAAGVGDAWVYDKANATLTEITDTDYPFKQTPSLGVNTVTYQDGFWVVSVKDSQSFYVSDLNDPTSWGALSFSSKEKHADPLVRCYSTRRELWLFGKTTTEVWHNVGAVPVPFEPLQQVLFDTGLLAPLSLARIDDTILFLGRDDTGWGKIIKFEGFQQQIVSNPAIESQLNTAIRTFTLDTNVDDFTKNIVAYTYKERGHSFYVLTIPANLQTDIFGPREGITFVYDVTQDFWHTRQSKFTDATHGEIEGRHFSGETFAMSRYKHYAGLYTGNKLYKLDVSEFTDFTERDAEGTITGSTPISRQRTAPYISNKQLRIFWDMVQVDVPSDAFNLTGVGTPEIKLTWSNDDGQSFSQGITRNIQGQRRLRFNRLGFSRDRVYRISTSSPANIPVLGSYASITLGDA